MTKEEYITNKHKEKDKFLNNITSKYLKKS